MAITTSTPSNTKDSSQMVSVAPQKTTFEASLASMHNPYSRYYPEHWPSNPFHDGEVELQKQAGVQESVMSYAPRVVRPYMPDQHRDFYQAQPFLVAAARDSQGSMWATLLTRPHSKQTSETESFANLVSSPDPVTLDISTAPVVGDALEHALVEGSDLGLLGIEFATKRRNRVNGRISQISNNETSVPTLSFHVDQSFGNCPQYIKPRKWWRGAANEGGEKEETSTSSKERFAAEEEPIQRPTELTQTQMDTIRKAQTVLVATGYRGEGEDPRFGNDASHRGGPAGFLVIQDSKTLVLPEFAGNNHFNSMGNLLKDPRMGITIPSFEDGGMLQLTGRAKVSMDTEEAEAFYPGALRLTTFHIEQVNDVPSGSLPIRWSVEAEAQTRQLQVSSIVQESENVKSFYFQPLPQDMQTLWEFTAGQHLPIQLHTPSGELLRTYSLSGSPKDNEYRISVKLEPLGKASTFLHHHMKVGDIINVSRPAGDFVMPTKNNQAIEEDSQRPLVLLSSGIGVTPILSMLHQYIELVQEQPSRRRQVYWIHGARNVAHHPFRAEVEGLVKKSGGHVATHVVYSRPLQEDDGLYDSKGHIDTSLLQGLVPDLKSADIFMCGNGGFMAELESGLLHMGVDSTHVFFETF